jgi:4-amino-4-deoxy-L-arabinose transferase-like glycosyltransferase
MQNVKKILMGRYFWLIAALVFAVSRIATWAFPFDSDHWIFFYVGKHWALGQTLYIDMWDHKAPLIFGYNAILYKLFGDNIVLHRIAFTVIALAAIYIFYKTALLLYKTLKISNAEWIARLSTLLFAFLANLSEFTNSGNNNENVGIVVLLLSLWTYLLYRRNPAKSQGYLLASGAFAGMLFFLKGNFAVLLIPILFDLYILHRRQWAKIISSYALFVVTPALMALTWAQYFVDQGSFKEYIVASFTFNSKYIRALGWDLHSPGLVIFLGILFLLFVFFAQSLVRAIREFWQPPRELPFFVPIMAVSVILFMLLLGTFYPHYYLMAIPYLCLVFGTTTSANFKKKKLPKVMLLIGILAILYIISLKQLYNSFSGSVQVEAKNQQLAASYVADHTKPNEKFFAYVYGATMYQLAGRDSGARFISASHPLIDYKYDFGYNFNARFITDMESNETKYVVISSDPNDLYRKQNPVLMRYFNKNYAYETSVGGFDILKRRTQ